MGAAGATHKQNNLEVKAKQKSVETMNIPTKASAAAASAAHPAALAGAAVVATSLAAAASMGGWGLGTGAAIATGSGGLGGLGAVAAAVTTPLPLALLGIAAISATGSLVMRRTSKVSSAVLAEKRWQPPRNTQTGAEPLLGETDAVPKPPASEQQASVPNQLGLAPAVPSVVQSKSQVDSQSEEDEEPPLKRRDPYRRKRPYLRRLAKRRISSWVTALVRGSKMVVNGEICQVALKYPGLKELIVGTCRLPLTGLGLRLNGNVLTVVASSDAQGGEGRTFDFEFDDGDTAVELALTLKVARGTADTGAGVFEWGERVPDMLKRPAPVE